jgi:hypothetical protein
LPPRPHFARFGHHPLPVDALPNGQINYGYFIIAKSITLHWKKFPHLFIFLPNCQQRVSARILGAKRSQPPLIIARVTGLHLSSLEFDQALAMTSEAEPGSRTHDNYTVGWICALPKEQTAATAMLDHRHADLLRPPNDPNIYTLGSIGQHNVVIACLPKSKIGTSPAATVAAWMISTFPSIRVGLMVGIGGGVPPKVRLGDVVVSTPVGQFPGVVQWDFGKAKEGGGFERTGSLNNPPTLLLSA